MISGDLDRSLAPPTTRPFYARSCDCQTVLGILGWPFSRRRVRMAQGPFARHRPGPFTTSWTARHRGLSGPFTAGHGHRPSPLGCVRTQRRM